MEDWLLLQFVNGSSFLSEVRTIAELYGAVSWLLFPRCMWSVIVTVDRKES